MKRILEYFYKIFVKIFGKFKNELAINFEGKELKFSTRSKLSKRWFFPRYISGKRVHEPPVAGLIAENIRTTDIFFDIGANLGFFSILAGHFCNRGGEVHTFEMDPQLIPLIEESISLNKNLSPVFINSFSCSNENAKICRFSAEQVGNPSTNRLIKKECNSEKIKCVTNVLSLSIDTYCKQVGIYPDFIKVDIEGAEVFAIPGMLETLEKNKPKMILELHPRFISDLDSSIKEIMEPILDLNYTAYLVKSYRRKLDGQLKSKLESFDFEKIDENKPNVLFLTQ